MTQFIEVTSTFLEKKVSINVAYIRDVVEKENGCFITTYEDNKKGVRGWETKESYTDVCRKIADCIY